MSFMMFDMATIVAGKDNVAKMERLLDLTGGRVNIMSPGESEDYSVSLFDVCLYNNAVRCVERLDQLGHGIQSSRFYESWLQVADNENFNGPMRALALHRHTESVAEQLRAAVEEPVAVRTRKRI